MWETLTPLRISASILVYSLSEVLLDPRPQNMYIPVGEK
jgi:hypothetical protein